MPLTTGKATDLITFSRGSLATVTDADGKIKWAPHNLLTNSEQFDASAWSKGTGATVSANYAVSPNGTTTADRLLETNTNDTHSVYRLDIALAAAAYTWGVFAKAGERNWLAIEPYDGSSYSTYFNLSTGSVGTSSAGNTANIVSVGNGWYLCTVMRTMSATASGGVGFRVTTGDGVGAYTGDPTKGILLWGASLTRADLGGMQSNPSAYPYYNPSTPRNLLGYSEDFSVASWPKDMTVTANAIAAPNGSLSADLLSGANGTYVSQNISSANPVATHTVSFHLKAGTVTSVRVSTYRISDGVQGYVDFNLTAGTAATPAGTYPPTNPVITPIGDGWYRCSFRTAFPSGTGIGVALYNLSGSTGNFYAWGAQLSDSASLDPYVPSFGAAPSAAAAHGARLDYTSAGVARGLLVEEARTNLLTHSNDFSTTGFAVATNIAVLTDNTTSPDGTSNADRLTDDATSGSHRLYRDYTFAAANAHTLSVYVKPNTHRWFRLLAFDGTNTFYANFDLTNGVVGLKHASATSAITALANGWYRISMTATVAAAAGNIQMVMLDSDTASTPALYAGTGTSLWLYGVQLEANASFPTSLIPTAAATVTRNADVASVGVSQFPYSSTEGTLVVNASIPVDGYSVTLSDGTTSNAILTRNAATGNAFLVRTTAGGVEVYIGTPTLNGKVAGAYKQNDFAASTNGGAVATDTTGNIPVITQMRIGAAADGGANINGHIRQITYIPRRLSNAELQSRSA